MVSQNHKITNIISCSHCTYFICDPVGDGTGIGKCQLYEDYCAKNPSERGKRMALSQLGDSAGVGVFWGGSQARECLKYELLN
jgi:hypothetical protein